MDTATENKNLPEYFNISAFQFINEKPYTKYFPFKNLDQVTN